MFRSSLTSVDYQLSHSLEDRMVKHFIRKQSKGDDRPKDCHCVKSKFNIIKKLKPVGKAIGVDRTRNGC